MHATASIEVNKSLLLMMSVVDRDLDFELPLIGNYLGWSDVLK